MLLVSCLFFSFLFLFLFYCFIFGSVFLHFFRTSSCSLLFTRLSPRHPLVWFIFLFFVNTLLTSLFGKCENSRSTETARGSYAPERRAPVTGRLSSKRSSSFSSHFSSCLNCHFREKKKEKQNSPLVRSRVFSIRPTESPFLWSTVVFFLRFNV